MRINSDNPPKTASGMWDSIVKHAESDPLTRDVLVIAEKDGMEDVQALVCLAYAALCARESTNDALMEIHNSMNIAVKVDDSIHDYVKGGGEL